MESKEAVLEGEAIGELVLEDGVNPGGVEGLVTVTVGLVVHKFTGVDTLLFIDLPEDDAAFFGGTEAVAVGSVVHLRVGEVAFIDEGLAEGGLGGEGFLDEVGGERDEGGGGWRGVGWRSGPDGGQVLGRAKRQSRAPVRFSRFSVLIMNLSPDRDDGDVELSDEPVAGFDEGEVLVVLHQLDDVAALATDKALKDVFCFVDVHRGMGIIVIPTLSTFGEFTHTIEGNA